MAKYIGGSIYGVTFEECPKTRVEFVKKWKSDYIFRSKAKASGFSVIGECVVFPNGKIAGMQVK